MDNIEWEDGKFVDIEVSENKKANAQKILDTINASSFVYLLDRKFKVADKIEVMQESSFRKAMIDECIAHNNNNMNGQQSYLYKIAKRIHDKDYTYSTYNSILASLNWRDRLLEKKLAEMIIEYKNEGIVGKVGIADNDKRIDYLLALVDCQHICKLIYDNDYPEGKKFRYSKEKVKSCKKEIRNYLLRIMQNDDYEKRINEMVSRLKTGHKESFYLGNMVLCQDLAQNKMRSSDN